MKHRFFSLLLFLSITLLVLENCHKEPKQTVKYTNEGDDSLFEGTKYKLAVPFGFPTYFVNPYADSLTVEGIQLGRMLFYDKHFSIDGQKACATCHHFNTAFSDQGRALSANEFGPTKRNAPSLQNMAWEPVMFWDGREPNPAAQAQNAFHGELGFNAVNAIDYLKTDSIYVRLFRKAFGRPGIITENEIYLAIQEFELTAVSCHSRFDSLQENLVQYTAAEDSAFFDLFITEKGECFHCHAYGNNLLMADYAPCCLYENDGVQPADSTYNFADPGRGAISGNVYELGCFKNPTLRNVAVSGPYMQNGKYKTLEQVINFYSDSINYTPNLPSFMLKHFDTTATGQVISPGGFRFSTEQKSQMLILLNDMTDYTYLNNPNLSDPFKAK